MLFTRTPTRGENDGSVGGVFSCRFPHLRFGVSCFSVSSVLGPGSPKVWPKLFCATIQGGGGGFNLRLGSWNDTSLLRSK